jgi:hypothetical protein
MKKILVLLVLLLAVLPSTAFAAYAHPDLAGPLVLTVDIYNNYIELNDTLVVAKYQIDYTTNPTMPFSDLYIGRLLDPLGADLGESNLYSYFDDGYDFGYFAIYFTAADAPAWGAADSVQLIGNPLVAWTPATPPSGSLSTISWHSTATLVATANLLGANVLSWAGSLGAQWSVALSQASPSGTVLTTYGDQYFSMVIPQLRYTCPSIYSASTEVITTIEPTSYNTPDSDILDTVWPWQTSSTYKLMMFMVLAMMMMYGFMRIGRVDLGSGAVLLMIPIAARVGLISLGAAVSVAVVCVLILGFTVVLQRGAQ